MLSTWPRRFPTSFEQPKIASPPSAQSSGYTQFTLRLRTVFSGKTMVLAELHNAGRVSAFRVERAMM
jgi:hypothetical protein